MQRYKICSKIWESRKYNGNGQEGNERDERPVDRKSREEHDRESKGDGEDRGGTSKRNDDGSTPENGDGSKRDKIYHWEQETRN